MSNVVPLKGLVTRLDIKAASMLRNISEEEPEDAFVITWPKDGTMPSYHSSTSNMPVVLMRLQEFIHKAYSGEFDV